MSTFLEKLNQVTESLSSCKGTKKENIYLPSIYEGCETTDAKKAIRKKIRNVAEKFCNDIITCKDDTKLAKLIADFKQFYAICYINNDYTISSIASKNTDSLQLDNYKKMFVIIETESAKETNQKAQNKK